jgi:Fe-S cluster assembly protein SufD
MDEIVNAEQKQHFFDDFEALRRTEKQEWLQRLRQQGMNRFAELELPHRKIEEWRFTNVNPITRTAFKNIAEPRHNGLDQADLSEVLYNEDGWNELVFVDGFYAPELSRVAAVEGLEAGSLRAYADSGDALLREQLGQHLNGASNVFSALNTGMMTDGAYVHLKRNTACEQPIHLVFATTDRGEDTAAHLRNLIVLDALSQASIIESYVNMGNPNTYLTNVVSETVLGEGAVLERSKVLNESDAGYHLSTTRTRQRKDSQLRSRSFFLNGKIARNALSTALEEEGAHASLNGLYLAEEGQLVDNYTSVDHKAPHCTSWVGYKGVLDGKSNAVFTGKVYVHRDAQKTDSNQLNQNLLLSDKATVDTKPVLEIYADDVKCTHGATVGRPPREQVYYFQTRGISEAMAQAMLTYGFADEVVADVPIEPLRKRLDRLVFARYSAKSTK